jgi:acyl-CoA thioester hydrolase
MPRVKLELPEKINFSCRIPVLIQHVNYGNHLGNDSLVSIIHEARMQWLKSIGCSELNMFGVGLILADLMVEYKAEGFYADLLKIDISIAELSRVGFSIYYKVSTTEKLIAQAKTGMVCFDYDVRKVVSVPTEFSDLFTHSK